MNSSKLAAVTVGSVVAVNNLADAAWFEVVNTDGAFHLIVREAGTNYAEQTIHRSMIAQIKAA